MSARPPLFLASASPQRAALLRQLGWAFTLLDGTVDEAVQPGEAPPLRVLRLAAAKAQAGWRHLDGRHPEAWVLAADTEVALGGEVLGKPRDLEHAAQLLRRLSGRCHQVYTGVVLLRARALYQAGHCSQVRMAPLSEADIAAYCASGEPLGKAGAYAIQGRAAAFIAHLEGSYSGVMGLPLYETARLLRAAEEDDAR